MLIIPIEQKLDSNNPPVITVLLIIVNFFVFFGYQQSNDENIINAGVDYYIQSNLYEHEKDVYTEYLRKSDPDNYRVYKELKDEDRIFWPIHDVEFGRFLRSDYFPNNVTALEWMDARTVFDRTMNKLSASQFGLIPADINLVDLFTSMFLHGDIGHLLGNMLFLFIYGYSLEIALGRLWYLGIYLLSGIGGGLLTWTTSPDSLIPTIGASGAIFGLLGMYLGLYGLRKIRFFFTVGFYAHHFVAPALILLPYWALIELYDQLAGQDYVAHYAHLGGLFTGVLIVAAGKNRFIKINREYVDKVDNELPVKTKYEQFVRQLEALNIPQAKALLADLLKLKPDDMQLLAHQFNLLKLTPENPEFELVARTVFSQSKTLAAETPIIARMAVDYDRYSKNHSAFDVNTRINLFNVFLRADHQEEAENQLQILREEPEAQNKVPGMLLRLSNYLSSHNQKTQADRYISQILERYPESDAAYQARALKNT
jgi:membrane associated rhomboid family serine protease